MLCRHAVMLVVLSTLTAPIMADSEAFANLNLMVEKGVDSAIIMPCIPGEDDCFYDVVPSRDCEKNEAPILVDGRGVEDTCVVPIAYCFPPESWLASCLECYKEDPPEWCLYASFRVSTSPVGAILYRSAIEN